ncbi:hypothetical protein L7F22_054403 [Adiantum nelumboides]|nr:hypothetical protein [Adiantum nelumboides]
MMNILALAYVASCLAGLVVVVPPEPLDAKQQPASSHEGPTHLLHSAKQAAKHAAQHVLCAHPPCPPTALDNLKDTVHHGYEKTADSIEGAKDFVSDRIEATKESAEDAYDHTKGSIHGTADKAKHGMHETVEKAKFGMHDAVDKAKHGVSDTVEKAKYGMRATADKAASLINGKDREIAHSEPDPESYIMPGVSKTMGTLKHTFEEERREIFTIIKDSPAMDALKRKAEEASGYALISRHIEDGIEGVKKGVKETVTGVQNKASHLLDCASDMAHCARDKAGNIIGGLKEKLTPHAHTKEAGDGLEMKVHELCSMYRVDRGKQDDRTQVFDTNAARESYAYLMESALRAVDGAKEIFEKAIAGEGSEWKEKYMYLADSAKGALEGANDVFQRAITSMEDDILQRQKEADDHAKAGLREVLTKKTSRLKEVAAHTKQRLSMTMRLLVRTFYLASFSIAFGISLWTTFGSGHLLSRALPRQQLALVQSKLFPVYLRVITGCLLVCAICHTALHPWPSGNWWEHLQSWNFLSSLVVSLCNMFVLEPKVTKVMFEKLRMEREEGRDQSGDSTDGATLVVSTSVDSKLKTLHQVASFANLVTIAGLTWHLWYLAHRVVL